MKTNLRTFAPLCIAMQIAVCVPSVAKSADTDGNEILLNRKLDTFNDVLTITRGFSPTSEGIIFQYRTLRVPLRGNVILSDVVAPGMDWRTGKGLPTELYDVTRQTPRNYHNSHNHYSNLFVETLNLTRGANGVSIWGDSSALTHGASAWGGFLSARSQCSENEESNRFWARYMPEGVVRNCVPGEFDAQLTGLEVDVLNNGLPGVFPNMAKHGVQVVGFGNPNSHAFSVIVENFDREREYQTGHFESILYAENSLADYGRFIVADIDNGKIGIDFRKPIFEQGAVSVRTSAPGEGIVFNNTLGGEIYGGERWPDFHDSRQWLTLKAGEGGLRIVNSDNTKEILAVDNFGGVYLFGDLFWNGQPVSFPVTHWHESKTIAILIGANVFFMITIILILWMTWRNRARVAGN